MVTLDCEDIKADRKFVVYAGGERFSMGEDVTAISVADMMEEVRRMVG